jgi:hypothetical protein
LKKRIYNLTLLVHQYTRQNPYIEHSKEAQIQDGDTIQVTNMNTRAWKDGSEVLVTQGMTLEVVAPSRHS